MSAVKKLIDELKKKENPDKPKVAPKPAALDLQPRRDNLDVPNAPRVRPISVSELKKNYLLSPQEPSPKPSALSPNPAFVPDQKPQPVIAAPAPMPKPKVNLVEQKPIAVSSPPVNFPKQAPIIAPPTHTPFAKPRPPTKSDEHKHSTIVAIAQEQKAGNSIASTQGKIEEHQPVPKSAPAPAPKPRLLTKLEDNNLPAKPVNTPSVIINSSHLVSNERGTSFISAEVASAITLVSKTPTSAISSAVVVNPISTHEQSAPASSTDKATTTAIPDRVSSPKPAPKPLPKSRTIAIHSAASRQNSADSGNPTLSRDNSFVKAPAPVLDSSKLSQDNSKVVAGRELQPAPVLLSKPSPVPSPMASRSATTVVKETINQPSNQRPLSPEVFPLSRDSKVSELKKSYNNIDKTIPKPDSLHNSVLSMNSERNRSGSMNRKDEKPTSRVASQLNLRGDKDVKRVGELEGELASLKSQLDALQIQLDASRLNYKLEVESLNEKHQEELEKVRAEVSAKKEEEFRQSNAKDDTALNA